MSSTPDVLPAGIARTIETVRTALAPFPSSAYRVARDAAPASHDEPDYFVHWGIRVEPVVATACPMEVSFATGRDSTPLCGFGFDSVPSLCRRLGLKQFFDGGHFAFGFEPIHLSHKELVGIVRATLRGELEARYVALFGYMLSAGGRILTHVGVPLLERRSMGRSYRYAPYMAFPDG